MSPSNTLDFAEPGGITVSDAVHGAARRYLTPENRTIGWFQGLKA